MLPIQCGNNNTQFIHKFYICQTDFDVICGMDLIPKLGITISGLSLTPLKCAITEDVAIQDPEPNAILFDIKKHKAIAEAIARNLETEPLPCNHPDALVHLQVDLSMMKQIRQYPIPEAYRPFVNKQVEDWLHEKVIEEALSGNVWNNPLLTVPKYTTSGEVDRTSRRVCLDARRLNEAITNDDTFPLPLISDIFARLKGARVFTELDIRQAYTQFPVDEMSRPYLGFTWNNTQYQFTRAIFGLKFMSSKFQRVIHHIFHGMAATEEYLDNIICYGPDLKSVEIATVKAIDKLTEYNLTLRPEKCKMFKTELRLLGFLIDSNGIRIDPHKHDIVDNLKLPTTGKEVESMLGLFNYFRKFLPNYASISAPWESVRKEDAIVATEKLKTSFEMLKHGIKNAGYIKHPDFQKEFFVATDASYDGLGAVLFQRPDPKGEICIIECASRALSQAEKNYSATKLELAGVIFSLTKFRQFLLLKKFTLFTDHSALLALFRTKFEYGILVNGWYETIYDFLDYMTIVHCPGTRNVLPDLLSRTYKIATLRCINIVKRVTANETVQDDEDIVIHLDETDDLPTTQQQQQQPDLRLQDDVLLTDVDQIEQRNTLIRDAHALGHFSADKVMSMIKSSGYTWPNMKKDITTFLDGCQTCQKYKIERVGFHPLKNLDAELPFDWICMDLFGPLPTTDNGNNYVLLVVDVCTRMVFLRSLRDKSAISVAEALIVLMTQFGLVKVISSDNDKAFVNEVLAEIIKSWKINQRTITPYHPRANGLAERNVGIAKDTLKRLIDDITVEFTNEESRSKKENGDLFIPVVELCLNVKRNATTLTSPFELFFGRPFIGFDDYLRAENRVMSTETLRARWKKIYELVYPSVRRLRSEKTEQSNASFERTHKVIDVDAIAPGTIVMQRIKGYDNGIKPNVFDDLFDGPFVVVRQNRAGNYILREKLTGNLLENSVPLDKLKILGGIKPVEILQTRRGRPDASLVLISDGSMIWMPSDADILTPIRQ